MRYALRQLGKAPGFVIAAVLTLALGIGPNAALFSAVYTLLLKSLPFQSADRIVSIYETHPQVAGGTEATFPDYLDWRTQQKSFEQIAAYSTLSPETMSSWLSMDARSRCTRCWRRGISFRCWERLRRLGGRSWSRTTLPGITMLRC